MDENKKNIEISSSTNKNFLYQSKKMIGLLLILCAVLMGVLFLSKYIPNPSPNREGSAGNNSPFNDFLGNVDLDIKRFASVDELKEYLSKAPEEGYYSRNAIQASLVEKSPNEQAFNDVAFTGMLYSDGGVPSRISETNVQVQGVDEPDIVKVDKKSLFLSFASDRYYLDQPTLMIEDIGVNREMPEVSRVVEATRIIKSFPPSEMEKIGGIDKIGDLLLSENILAIFTNDGIYGYDVSDRSNPKEAWKVPYEDKTRYVDARLYADQIFLITNTYLDISNPCPYIPLKHNENSISVDCQDIYYPASVIPSKSTYTVLKLKIQTGDIVDKISFLGTLGDATTYMSENNLYLTYSYQEDFVSIFVRFLDDKASEIFPIEIKNKLKKLSTYDIGSEAKMTEFTNILEQYLMGLSDDEQMRVENEFENRFNDFSKEHAREFETTGIVKIDVGNLEIRETGKVPGHPLNQFSLDEYKGNLRIATNSGSLDFGSSGDVNDVYVLNSNLDIQGVVKDLGKGERIYSARFIGNRGYVVTFRETDPFYVLDLSNPKSPEMKGELKIPGYSSYLHPINEDIILGVGKEGSNVKISLFDVSNASNPTEIDKYQMDEYWSEAVNNHHAFLMDAKHSAFFMPGSKGGYIFSYENNKLKLLRAVSSTGVKRAVYLDDYMYIVGQEGIVVLNEKDWQEVKDFKF